LFQVFGSFAEHLEFLLKSLNSGGRQSKPIVFVLEELALFCGHHNQVQKNKEKFSQNFIGKSLNYNSVISTH
jgi:hypothetical protein